ncbi:hypothetical protein FRC07_003561 [Ceratobasidium sp. 392]|nr:hypothetical protein FRC07_003561 [Ceratobasidium sp. 392]
MVEEALAAIDSELELLVSEEEALRDMRISLSTARNNLVTLTPANALPPEILARIFTLSRTMCLCDDRFNINNTAGVCTYWRRTAVDMTNMWTHVDVGPGISKDLVELLLRRSKNLPIHVHVIEPEKDNYVDDPGEGACTRMMEDIMIMLEPHVHRVCTLKIKSTSKYDNLIPVALDLWSNHSSIHSLRSLLVDRPESLNLVSIQKEGEAASQSLQWTLLALDTLYLVDTVFHWDSKAYCGLVDIRLDFNYGVSIHMSQLSSILSACPALATLKFAYLNVSTDKGWDKSVPIVMRFLKVVNLVDMEIEDALLALSLITLLGHHTELGVGFSGVDDTTSIGLIDFFARSEVNTLYCCGFEYTFEAWESVFNSIPHPPTLVLHDFRLACREFSQPCALPSPQDLPPIMTVLVRCVVDFESLKCLIAKYGTRNLHLERCRTPMHQGLSLQDIQASLLELYPGLRCSISDIDSTEQLACRSHDV